MAGTAGTAPGERIQARLDELGKNQAWLIRELEQKGGLSRSAAKSRVDGAINRGRVPNVSSAQLFAVVLGGFAAEYGAEPSSPRPMRQSATRKELQAIEKRLAAVEQSLADLAGVQSRVSEQAIDDTMRETLRRAQQLSNRGEMVN